MPTWLAIWAGVTIVLFVVMVFVALVVMIALSWLGRNRI